MLRCVPRRHVPRDDMKVVVGLGNPGFRYKKTRHNIGSRVLGVFAKKHGIRLKKKGFLGIYGTGKVNDQEVMLLRPLTYMNLSGEAVKSVYSSGRVEKEAILVVSDDFNLPLGVLRLREKGSAGGHKGLESIAEKIGADFNRLRIGIGSENMPEDRSGYVLSVFSRKDRSLLEEAVKRAVESIEAWIARSR